MKPSPWTAEATSPGEREAAQALAAAQTEPAPLSPTEERAWLEAIRARTVVASPAWRRPALWVPALAASALLAVALHRPAPLPAPVVASAETHYALVPAAPGRDAALRVEHGLVKVHTAARARYTLEAPGLQGRVDAAAFSVQVAGALSTLELFEGSAELRSRDGRPVALAAGQRIRSDDARLQAATDACLGQGSLASRRGCYERIAAGEDLAAQNAVLELGLLEQEEAHSGAAALSAWRGYQRRFPGGPLGPEASVAILGELLAEHRLDDARSEADRFLGQYPQDGRASEVRLTRAELECQASGAPALAAFDALTGAAGVDPEALLLRRGRCEAQLGRRDDARLHWRQALDRAPAGPQAAELKKLLGE